MNLMKMDLLLLEKEKKDFKFDINIILNIKLQLYIL